MTGTVFAAFALIGVTVTIVLVIYLFVNDSKRYLGIVKVAFSAIFIVLAISAYFTYKSHLEQIDANIAAFKKAKLLICANENSKEYPFVVVSLKNGYEIANDRYFIKNDNGILIEHCEIKR